MAIIGSCVTRDAFDFEKLALPSPFLFYARTSFATLTAPAIDPIKAGLSSQWENRNVQAEIGKTHLADVFSIKPKYIIFDFIDERFDLIAINDSFINCSFAIVSAGIPERLTGHRIIPRLSSEARQLWLEGLLKISAFLSLPAFAKTRVILHKARWAEAYVKSGVVSKFPKSTPILPNQHADILAHNTLLDFYHGKFAELIPNTSVISVKSEYLVADAAHKWELSPYHYIPEYYSEFVTQLKALL
jgi:hypothetical protein